MTTLTKSAAVKVTAQVLSRPRVMWTLGAFARAVLNVLPSGMARLASGAWGRARQLPPAPRQSFHAWYESHRRNTAPREGEGEGEGEGDA
jgi:L-lactate dehydrogenase complex protein LldF